jgi:P4 family phage/plasmid primase-like protien
MSAKICDDVKAFAETNGVVVEPAAKPESPAAWFAAKFPALVAEFGVAVEECPAAENEGLPWVRDLSEDFLAATLGQTGSPDSPTVFVAEENRFYSYSLEEGVFVETRESRLQTRLSNLLLECARACDGKFNTRNLAFKFRDTASLSGVMNRARGLLEVGQDFFQADLMEFVPCKNGMLRVEDLTLLPFSPAYRRRNKLAVAYDPAATCRLFLDTLLTPALGPEELDLLQRWCGLALIGVNLAQRLIILTGMAGGGKGTFIRVVNEIIGKVNVGTLRPDWLADRFELGRLLGKSLLYGADVPENFLNCRGASVLKALTGGDPVTLEFKGSNERPEIVCRFNAIVTSNSRLTVHLEGDADAWRRRLVIVPYEKPKPENVIADLSEQIIAKEASGVLNWMLAGLKNIRAAGWQLVLNERQQHLVDDLLLESEADAVFAKECLQKDPQSSLLAGECYERYVRYCNNRNWAVMPKKKFSAVINDTIARLFALPMRHDIEDADGKKQRGWKGISCNV